MAENMLGVDLSNLKVVGAVDLPTIGYTYATMNQCIASTTAYDRSAFVTHSGDLAPAHAPWSELRDLLQEMFGRTANDMHRAAGVILNAVEAYAGTDEAAGKKLTESWNNGVSAHMLDAEGSFVHDSPPPVIIPDGH